MSGFINDFKQFAKAKGYNILSVAEIKDGVAESECFMPCSAAFDCYSVAKVFVVTAIGLLHGDGLLSLDDKVCDLLADDCPEDTLPPYRELTVDAVLRHRIGLPAGYLDIDCERPELYGTDFLRSVFTVPPTDGIGKDYAYTDAAYYVLARVVEKVAGLPLETFMWQRLFTPLAFREAAWSKCPLGHAMGATGLFLHAEDVAKLGVLYLNGGRRQGKQILSEQWVSTVLERHYELSPIGEAYGKGGMHGQYLIIIPSEGRAVAWQSLDSRRQDALVEWVAEYKEDI